MEETHWEIQRHVEAIDNRYIGQDRHVPIPVHIPETFTESQAGRGVEAVMVNGKKR